MREEAKGRKEIQYCIESPGPACGQLTHVTAGVPEPRASTALPSNGEQLTGIIETIHIVSRFRQQVRVSSLSARNIEHARSDRQAEQIDEARCFLTIALGRKEEPVFQEIVGIEGRLPPLARFLQKKTGSR
jgi:hypothetical protein